MWLFSLLINAQIIFWNKKELKVTPSVCLFCLKSNSSSFIVINYKEKQQILIFKKLESENV